MIVIDAFNAFFALGLITVSLVLCWKIHEGDFDEYFYGESDED